MYTNVFQRGNFLYVRSIEDNKRTQQKINFHPTIWTQGRSGTSITNWHTLDGVAVYDLKPGSIYDCKEYVDKYKDVHGMNIYESPGHVYQYIAENYREEIHPNLSQVRVVTIDIETEIEYGFPDPQSAAERIILITVKDTRSNLISTFGLYPYNSTDVNVKYNVAQNEQTLLKLFLHYWQSNYPDVVTGWNSSLFDITYLYNRMRRVIGDQLANKLSPWGHVSQREIDFGGRTSIKTYIAGIASLDYLDLYKKFTYSAQESYKLDYIASVELGIRKLENPGTSFKDFYTNYWDVFCEYNIRDVELVDKLDEKMKLIDLALTMAYAVKSNYEDIFSPVKCWDIILYNYLNNLNIVIPRRKEGIQKEKTYEGAYVKDPIVGRHRWVCSFDLNSLYPHLIMQYNMSPETITESKIDVTVNQLLNKECDLSTVYEKDYSMAANGWCFSKQNTGLLPTQMELFYNKRVEYKNAMLAAKQKYEDTGDEKYLNQISTFNNLQMAMKILLNSCYGAFGNVAFRYFDMRIAEGITISGQLSIRWIANKLNQLLNKTLNTTDTDRIVLIDTDSVVLSLEDLIEKVCPDKTVEQKIKYMDKVSEQIIQPFIDKSYQELAEYMNAYKQKMQMKRENLVDQMVSVSKKRYLMSVYNSEGVQYKEPKLKIMGLQMVKSSTPAVVRVKLKDSLKTILHGTEHDVQRYVAEYKQEFKQLPVEQIAFPRGISDVTKYHDGSSIFKKGTPIHVRGALLYNHHLKQLKLTKQYPLIKEGDKIKFTYLKTPNPIGEDCISFIDKIPDEFQLSEYCDYDTMFEKTYQDAIQNILNVLGWNCEQIATLEDFFV